MILTARQLMTAIRGELYPSGEQENLVAAHDQLFQEAFAEIAKWVPCEQTDNVNTTDFCATNFLRGMSVIAQPDGIVRRVYAVANHDYEDPIFYKEVDFEYLRQWAVTLVGSVGLLPANPTTYPLGFAEANSQYDCACGRARVAFFAKSKGNIYTAPWLQSMETLVVEWDGIKTNWADADAVTQTLDYKRAIKQYFQYAHERDYGNPQRAAMFYNPNTTPHSGIFAESRAALMWQCDQKRKMRDTPPEPDRTMLVTPQVIERGLPDPNAAPIDGIPQPLHGIGAPAANLGVPGDTYIQDDTNALYWKDVNGWHP